jgi:hypothetical protein
MDPPKTRRESKKDPKEKAKKGEYSQKHVRLTFKLIERGSKNANL